MKVLDESKATLELSKNYERVIILLVRSNEALDGDTIISVISRATLEMFYKQRAPLLTSFYKVRFIINITIKLVLPNKGTVAKLYQGELDKKYEDLA